MKTKSKGIFRQLSDKTWMIDSKIKIDGTFRHFTKKGYLTLSEAKADYERAKAEFIQSKEIHCKVAFFDDILNEYKKMRKITVDVSTLGCDQSCFNVYLLPYFGGKQIKDAFNKDYFQAWYEKFINDPHFSNNKKSKVITRVKDVLKFAYMHKYIDAIMYQDCDVCLYQVKYSKKPMVERVAWTFAEEKELFNVIDKDSPDYVMFKLFLQCSPRLGEFLALMPKSYDRNKKRIVINQQVKNINGHGAVLTDKLKTHESYRTIAIDTEMAELLNEYIDNLGIKDDEYLFFGTNKRCPMARNTFRRKLYKYEDLAGIRRNVPHGIRHTVATQMASLCETATDLEAAAKRMGHSAEMFLNTYGFHNTDETEDKLVERLNKRATA